MKIFLVVVLSLITTTATLAQTDSTHHKKDSIPHNTKPAKTNLSQTLLGTGPADHFLIQFGYAGWSNVPDSIITTGFSRSFNFYFMFNFPFKTDPRLSVGAGLGVGWANIFFDKQQVLITAQNPTLAFPNQAASNHFKKYKLVSSFLDVPIELRFALDPEHMNSSWKFAVGTKVGLLLSTYTKAKNMENAQNQPLNDYIEKEKSNKYFNSYQLDATLRISYGVLGIYGQYQLTPIIKSVAGPNIYPYEIGIVISGL
jgi:hypothetical protein